MPRPGSILIVEDDALLASSLQEVLENLGFSVSAIASTGAEALATAEDHPPIVALVDIRLSGPLDGIEVCLRLRERLGTPAIIISGLTDDETMGRVAAAKPVCFLKKPFRLSQVLAAIESVMDSAVA